MKVYLLTTGEYEDYRIKGIYLHESDAEQAAIAYDHNRPLHMEPVNSIEEWEVIE